MIRIITAYVIGGLCLLGGTVAYFFAPTILIRGAGLAGAALVMLMVYLILGRGRYATVVVGIAASAAAGWIVAEFIWTIFLEAGLKISVWREQQWHLGQLAPLVAFIIGGSVARFGLNPYWSRRLRSRIDNFERAKTNEHGSADFMPDREIRKLGKPEGFICGEHDGKLIWLPCGKHILSVVPTRGGKGVLIIANLLKRRGPVLCVDPKLEAAAVVARARRDMGQKVVIINPFSMAGLPNEWHYNPLDWIRNDVNFSADCETVGEAMIAEGKNEKEHFSDVLRIVLPGFIAWVAATERGARRNLGRVYELLNETPQEILEEVLLPMMIRDPRVGAGLPARAATMIMGVAHQERGSMWSTVRRQTAFLQEPRVREVLSRSDFSMHELLDGTTDIFVGVPVRLLKKQARLIRLFVQLGMATIMDAAPARRPAKEVTVILDELPTYGKGLDTVTTDVALAAGYGVVVWVLFQNSGQGVETFGREGFQTLRAGAGITHFFRVARGDDETAELVSKLLGETTVKAHGHQAGTGSRQNERTLFGEQNDSLGLSEQVVKRRLMTATEVQELDEETVIVFADARAPILLTKPKYWLRSDMHGLFDPNPYRDNEDAETIEEET